MIKTSYELSLDNYVIGRDYLVSYSIHVETLQASRSGNTWTIGLTGLTDTPYKDMLEYINDMSIPTKEITNIKPFISSLID